MITDGNTRQYRTNLFALSCAVLMWTGAMWVYRGAPEKIDFLTLGLGVGLAIGGALAPRAVANVAEWKARAADTGSSIAEQVDAEARAATSKKTPASATGAEKEG